MSAIRVLLVDDEKLILSSLRRLLRRRDFEVFVAESGPEGLAFLDENGGAVDLIVSDYQMPGMTGVEFLRQVADRWPAPVRCMLTAQADQATLDEALATGLLHRAFTKPWDNSELANSLEAVLASNA